MKKFILAINSLVKTFSVSEAGEDITFSYSNKSGDKIFNGISVGDRILVYFGEPEKTVKCVLEVKEIKDSETVVLNKILETAKGCVPEDKIKNIAERLKLAELSEEEYSFILSEMLSEFTHSEVREDIFSGFSDWLTSYRNPDYSGTEKYDGYPRALERLVEFMGDKGIIGEIDLNNADAEAYRSCLCAYNNSEEAKEFDKTKLSNLAGSYALKKYIKYVECLSDKAEVFDYSVTGGEGVCEIVCGTPGCGKSYYVDHTLLGKNKETKEYDGEFKEQNIIRTTFYNDYSNADFVGQLLPRVVKNESGNAVEYAFNPGPFTLAFIRAVSNPAERIALVIEELNRGNAPAIFGDIFQLLDRREDNAVSEYGIVNVPMTDYLNEYVFSVNGKEKSYKFNEIKLPGNLYIYATMNTSDQNVYTLDTAFTRRWDKEQTENSFDECAFANRRVPGMEQYTWKSFVNAVNGRMTENLEQLQINEDKQIGAYFVKAKDLAENADRLDEKTHLKLKQRFAYKVLDYLWNDAAKLEREVFFDEKYNTLQGLIKDYVKIGEKIFCAEMLSRLLYESQNDGGEDERGEM